MAESVTLDLVLDYLNAEQIRATYGAVAHVIGVHQVTLGGQLGPRNQRSSWVVNSSTNLPTGFRIAEMHRDLDRTDEIISDGDTLVLQIDKWLQDDRPRREPTWRTPLHRFSFRHEPQTEEEVVCLFIALLGEHLARQVGEALGDANECPPPVVIETVRMAYPDCTITVGGKRKRIEFELYSSHFDHDPAGCDAVVCWKNDKPDAHPVIVPLAPVLNGRYMELFEHINDVFPKPWDEASFITAGEKQLTDARDLERCRQLIVLVQSAGLGPHWLVAARPGFSVGTAGRTFFKIRATGKLYLNPAPTANWRALEDLNAGLSMLELQLPARRAKVKRSSGTLSGLFSTEDALRQFVEVWRVFGDAIGSVE